MTQQALAARLGISSSYLNLIEHDQRAVTASLLIKLTEILGVELSVLSGQAERQLESALREVFSEPLLGLDEIPENEITGIAASAPADRARYVRDVRVSAEAQGFPWAFWNLFDSLGLLVDDVSRQLDPAMIEALGLKMPG